MQSRLANIVSHAATAYVVLALGIVLSAATAYWTANQVERNTKAKFEIAVADAEDGIERRIQSNTDALYGARGLFSASESVSRDVFQRYVSSLNFEQRYPGIQVIGFNRRVPFERKRDYQTAVRRDTSIDPKGYPHFAIKPPGDRLEYFVVEYLEPMAGNEEAFGLDVGGDAVRLAGVERARDSGQLAASGRITIARGDTRHVGFALRLPIYRNGMPQQTIEQRREALVGLIAASYRMDYMMRNALSEQLLRQFRIRIHDAGYFDSLAPPDSPVAENLLFDNGQLLNTGSAQPGPSLANDENASLSKTLTLDVGGRRWNVYFTARHEFGSPSDRWLPFGVLFGGITISLLLFGLIRSIETVGSRAVTLAASITEDLRRSEASLSEAQRRTQELIEVLPNPVFFKGTDGRYLGVNKAWEKYFGLPRDAFIGKTVHDLYPNDPEVAKRLHADDQVLWGQAGTTVYETVITTPDGRRHDAIYYKATFAHADGSVAGLIGTIIDITERKQAEAAVKESEERFRATFDQAAVGIVHTSLDGHYLKVNRKFCEMLGYSESELVGRIAADFTHPEDRASGQNYRQLMLERKLDKFSEERRYLRKNGGVIWTNRTVSLAHDASGQPMYFIRVIEDITDRKEVEERYRATFDNAPVGIMHTAVEGYGILRANHKLCEMLGYTQDELLDMTSTDLVHPDFRFTDRSSYKNQMLTDELPSFSSERKFLRKDGSSIWVNRTVSLVHDAAGKPLYFIRIIEDISERKQAELRQVMEHTVTRLLSEAGSPGEVIPKILQTIGETLGCACGTCWLRDEHQLVWKCAETWSISSDEILEFVALCRQPKSPAPITGGLIRRVRNSGEPVWITDVTQDASFRRASFAAKAGLHGAFGFPIRFGDDILGVMEFFSRTSRPPDEVLLRSTRSIGSQIGQYMARNQAEERVRHLAHYDELTGLPNRSMFNQQLTRALAQARRHDKPLAVLFIDLDRFKNINDTLGHDAGDRVLKDVAERLRGCLRDSDTVGRLGGDEFVVLIEELPEPMQVASVAQKILAAVARPFTLDLQEFHITASIGISTYPADSEDMQSLLKNADISMYRAKEQGKNNYQYYSAQMNVHSIERLALESSLRHALERNEFLLHYQPKVDIRSGHITGMEALVRWQQPGKALIPPAQFIPLAEETGLIVPIGEWVLKTACARNKSWRDAGLPPLRIAVNLSARQFAHENLLQDVARVLQETGMDPAALEFEITESMVMRNPEHAAKLLANIKAMGIHLSIDDFGTGYSSLSYLKRFPIDSVKIDRSFIRDIPGDTDDAAITQAIIAMAHGLRLKVIAEGVETEEQLSFLRDHGCDEMQGYYFSRPLPEDEVLRLLQECATADATFALR